MEDWIGFLRSKVGDDPSSLSKFFCLLEYDSKAISDHKVELDKIPFRSPVQVVNERCALSCEAALMGAMALDKFYLPGNLFLIDRSNKDKSAKVVLTYAEGGRFGAISHFGNEENLTREPVFNGIGPLVNSYSKSVSGWSPCRFVLASNFHKYLPDGWHGRTDLSQLDFNGILLGKKVFEAHTG